MNIRTAILLLSVALTHVAHVRAEDATAEDRALLEKLRADDYDERIAARTKLLQRGEAIRDLVTAELARPDLDADYKTNLKVLATGLAELDILKPFDNPKRADFAFKNETVDSALKKITDTFGQTVTAGEGVGLKVVTLGLKQKSFIEALEAVRIAAALNYAPKYIDLTVQLNQLEAPLPFPNLTLIKPPDGPVDIVATSGPFALALNDLDINRRPADKVVLGASDEFLQGTLYFNQDVHVMKAKITSLKADNGASVYDLLNMAQMGQLNAVRRVNQSFVCRVNNGKSGESLPFILGLSTDFTSIPDGPLPSDLKWKLGLTFEIDLASTEERIELDHTKQATPQTLGIGVVTIHSLESLKGGWALECSIPMDIYAGRRAREKYIPFVSDAFPMPGADNTHNDIQILDEKGKQLPWTRIGAKIERSAAGVAYRLTMKTQSKPKTIVFKHATRSVQREFEFEFPSVPIPLNKAMEK